MSHLAECARHEADPPFNQKGIAIVAHLFSVPFHSPLLSQGSSTRSPFDDPFASASSAASSGADMCLGLEMLRGGDIRVVETDLQVGGECGLSVETPTDVRVYVDERCPESVGWFERTFCVEGRQGRGVKLDVGGECAV